MRSRSGIALMVIVGILGVIVVLAAAFVTLAQLERRASQQRLHATQAFFLARSGLEDALARLGAGQDPDAPDSRYGGEDLDGNGLMDPGLETDEQLFHPESLDLEACPVGMAVRPSFCAGHLTCDGRTRGYSGALAWGHYALKVQQEGGIDVNGADTPALRRILSLLALELGQDPAAGEALVGSRPAEGWTSFEQMSGNPEALAVLKPYLTLHAWRDPRVIRPNATPFLPNLPGQTWAEFAIGRADDGSLSGLRDPVTPLLEPRAPVLLSWARSRRPVLMALLRGLSGIRVLDRNPAAATVALEDDEAASVADALMAWTSDLSTWQDFNAFCDTLFVDGHGETSSDGLAKRDLIKANFNPNSDLNKFNPNASTWKCMDKSDLLVYSTEFGLYPLQGARVESVGRLLDPSGRLLASRVLSAQVSGPGVLRLSTQRDFVCEDLDSPGSVRLPGASSYLGTNASAVRTWGAALGIGGKGVGVQTYPEPYADPGSGLMMHPAEYDGNLQLATIETADEEFYTASPDASGHPTRGSPPGTKRLGMLARWDDRLDLDRVRAPGTEAMDPDARQVSTAELDHGLLDPSKPTSLRPDGCYSESGRAPSYLDHGNADGFHGVMSFWVKPSYSMAPNPMQASPRGHAYVQWLNGSRVEEDSSPPPPNGPWFRTQFFLIGDVLHGWGTTPGVSNLVAQFEIGHFSLDTGREHGFYTELRPDQPHLWRLVTLGWDMEAGDGNACGDFLVNDAHTPSDLALEDVYSGQGGNLPLEAEDITADAPPWAMADSSLMLAQPHHLFLGHRHPPNDRFWNANEASGWSYAGPADATFDEFAVWDFGPSPEAAAQTLARTRYQDGRYFQGEGEYTTGRLRLPVEARLRRICWTWIRPAALGGDYPELDLMDAAGTDYLRGEGFSRSTAAPGWGPDLPHWDLGGVPASAFRLRVRFRRVAPLDPRTPLLDSPVLDDLTLLYDGPQGPRILAWGE